MCWSREPDHSLYHPPSPSPSFQNHLPDPPLFLKISHPPTLPKVCFGGMNPPQPQLFFAKFFLNLQTVQDPCPLV